IHPLDIMYENDVDLLPYLYWDGDESRSITIQRQILSIKEAIDSSPIIRKEKLCNELLLLCKQLPYAQQQNEKFNTMLALVDTYRYSLKNNEQAQSLVKQMQADIENELSAGIGTVDEQLNLKLQWRKLNDMFPDITGEAMEKLEVDSFHIFCCSADPEDERGPTCYGPTHPEYLRSQLEKAKYFRENLNEPEQAKNLALKAFENAISELDTLSEDSYKDSTLVMQSLRDFVQEQELTESLTLTMAQLSQVQNDTYAVEERKESSNMDHDAAFMIFDTPIHVEDDEGDSDRRVYSYSVNDVEKKDTDDLNKLNYSSDFYFKMPYSYCVEKEKSLTEQLQNDTLELQKTTVQEMATTAVEKSPMSSIQHDSLLTSASLKLKPQRRQHVRTLVIPSEPEIHHSMNIPSTCPAVAIPYSTSSVQLSGSPTRAALPAPPPPPPPPKSYSNELTSKNMTYSSHQHLIGAAEISSKPLQRTQRPQNQTPWTARYSSQRVIKTVPSVEAIPQLKNYHSFYKERIQSVPYLVQQNMTCVPTMARPIPQLPPECQPQPLKDSNRKVQQPELGLVIDYAKWKQIEVLDDEDDTHPCIGTSSLRPWRPHSRIESKKAEVLPLSLGVEIYDGLMLILFDKNTHVPTGQQKFGIFTNAHRYQQTVSIKLYQGESRFTKDNITITIYFSDHVALTLIADIHNGETRSITVSSDKIRLPESAIEQYLQSYIEVPAKQIQTDINNLICTLVIVIDFIYHSKKMEPFMLSIDMDMIKMISLEHVTLSADENIRLQKAIDYVTQTRQKYSIYCTPLELRKTFELYVQALMGLI
ncbi:unnamed protein product, partial [Didymodactylos carnosus]